MHLLTEAGMVGATDGTRIGAKADGKKDVARARGEREEIDPASRS